MADGLTEDQALELEEELMQQYGATLVNRQNFGRGINLAEWKREEEFRRQRDEAVATASKASRVDERIKYLESALALHDQASACNVEPGLVGQILRELPPLGNFEIIKALVTAHLEAANVEGADLALRRYLARYTGHVSHKGIGVIQRRVTKAMAKKAKP
ncbi:hypothetical protein B0E48_00660 [Rhodanobacter sp. C03]|nr:hypothetical protein B0E48_00660 [Rhodanobacter sp. C03]